MKKFGTPGLAAPGIGARERRVVLRRAAAPDRPAPAWASASASGPCRSATPCWPCRWPCWPPRSTSSFGLGRSVLSTLSFVEPLSWSCRTSASASALGARLRGRRGRRGRLDRDHGRRGGGRRRRALGRAEIDDRGDRRGQARDLDLIDRRTGRDVRRHRDLLAGDQRHAQVVHLGVRVRHENPRVERGSGKRDGERDGGRS